MVAPSPDSGAVGGTASGTSVSNTIALIGTNRVIILTVGITTDDHVNAAARTVTGVSDTSSLTWTLHKRTTWSYTVSGETTHNTIEVWWAPSSAQVTPSITFTVSGSYTNLGYVMRAFGGCHDINAPFDSNAAVPASVTDVTGSTTTPQDTYSTSQAHDLIHQFAVFHGGTGGTVGSGYTQLDTISLSTTFANNGLAPAQFYTQYRTASATQSSVTDGLGASFKDWTIVTFALTGDAATNSGTWASTDTPDTFSALAYPGFPGTTGDLLATEAPDVFAGAGFPNIVGTLFAHEATDTFSAFGRQPQLGAWASTEHPDRFTGTGIGLGEDGTWVSTEPVDTFAALGYQPISATFDTSETADRFVAFGPGVLNTRRRRVFFTA